MSTRAHDRLYHRIVDDRRLCFDGCYEPIMTGKQVVLPSMATDTVTALNSETGDERRTFSKPESLRPEERQILDSRVRLHVDPANVKDLGTFREPVLSREAIYYSVPDNEIGRRFRGEDLPLINSPQYREIAACDATRPLTPSATHHGDWGSPNWLVQWPAARFEQAWTLPSDLKVHIKALVRPCLKECMMSPPSQVPRRGRRVARHWNCTLSRSTLRPAAGG